MKSPAELTEAFRASGRKVTPQRRRIFEVLYGREEHLTAETVFEEVRADMPTISLKTVYQTLNDLAAMREIQALSLDSGSTRFDPNVESHHHIVCESCGRVQDVYGEFDQIDDAVGDTHGFSISSAEVVFRGLCPACAKVTRNKKSKKQKERSLHAS